MFSKKQKIKKLDTGIITPVKAQVFFCFLTKALADVLEDKYDLYLNLI